MNEELKDKFREQIRPLFEQFETEIRQDEKLKLLHLIEQYQCYADEVHCTCMQELKISLK